MLNPLKIETNGNEDLLNDSLKAFFNEMGDNKYKNPFSERSIDKFDSENPFPIYSEKRFVEKI